MYVVVIIENILLSIYYVLGTRSGAVTFVYVYVYVYIHPYTLSASCFFSFLYFLVNREGVVCANIGLETNCVFIQRVENDHHLVFYDGLRETGTMTENSSGTI